MHFRFKCAAPDFEGLFWLKVDKGPHPKGCWLYCRKDKRGYGRYDRKGPYVFAHRCAWLFTFGQIPEDKEVAHTCDVRNCCNPEHLFLATHDENMKDCQKKGRNVRGERSHYAKLTPEQVRQIRLEYRFWREGKIRRSNAKELAARYGVRPGAITNITSGRLWKHV